MKETVENILTLFKSFEEDATKALSGNKAAAQRSRKTSNLIAAALKEYRKLSIEEGKK